ncbi:hypothetical protein NA57DRAFT_70135 [Rhizodiscina lignyota]|uniref:E3 UFM1-protein ligase-like C-terminal domain-containing protein n=1 Tax=Rhizodiscina lignyota TaxID=1504668 RepID=A0A9P4IPX4_9PEZI|nr:hypothetical protein NA57DRAFT_70135 [Rhizodiscina lignyota]
MSDDIFSIRDIKDIVLSFPVHSNWNTEPHDADLVPAADGDGLVLKTIVLNALDDLTQTTSRRMSMRDLSDTLDVDINILDEILDLSEKSPCYSIDGKSLIFMPEVHELLAELTSKAREVFVEVQEFCRIADISQHNLLHQIRLRNVESEYRLGTVKWSNGAGPKADLYIFTDSLMSTAKGQIAASVKEALQEAKRVVWSRKMMYGLGATSFTNLVQKVAHDQIENGRDEAWAMATDDNDNVIFTPEASIAKARDDRIEAVRTKIKDLDENKREFFSIAELAAEAPDLFQDSRSTIYAMQDELRGSNSVILLGEFAVSKSFVLQAASVLSSKIQQSANDAWDAYAASPTTVSYPTASSTISLREQSKLSDDSKVPEELVRVIFDTEVAKTAKAAYNARIAQLDAEDENLFAEAWRDEIMLRVQLYHRAVQSLEGGKLRSELTSLLNIYMTKDLLPSSFMEVARKSEQESSNGSRSFVRIDPMTGKRAPKFYGKRLVPATEKLKTQCEAFEESEDAEADLQRIRTAMEAFAAKFGIDSVTDDDLTGKKQAFLQDMSEKLDPTKAGKDKDGSTLFLAVVLILIARHNQGLLYATGRFVPRLLKLLKPSIGEAQYERLQVLKEEVKKGFLTPEQREELVAMVV